jgi:predicted metal-dependent hydrolase
MAEQLGLFDNRWPQAAGTLEAPLAIRESARARRLTLRMLPPHTLELVVPRGTRPNKIQAFVTQHRAWIARARREIATRYRATVEPLPARLDLVAAGEIWHATYRLERGVRPAWRVIDDRLEIDAPDGSHSTAQALLRAWLVDHAKTHLPPWLAREAAEVGRRPRSVQVRLQRTRWGSCSAAGRINLNAALLFLDRALVRYLLIHELCHLISLDHSRRFWTTVERFEPRYRGLDRALGRAWALVPLWVHRS